MDDLLAVILVALISALEVVWLLGRLIEPIALVMIFLILICVLVAITRMGKRVFWQLMLIIFMAHLFNLGYLWLSLGSGVILYVALIICCIGLGLSIVNLSGNKKREVRRAAIYPAVERVAAWKRTEEMAKKSDGATEIAAKKAGKTEFVASKRGKQYHVPRCRWAKRINKDNILWFETEEKARKAGYTRHYCVKQS